MHAGARSHLWVALCTLLGACGGDAPTGPPSVAEVTITPPTTSVRVGESLLLTATARDQAGNALSGRTVVWTSVNASIASVTTAGVVTGISEGTTDVSAVVDGTSETVALTVTPARIASIEVRPTVAQVLVGATIQMTATPRSPSGLPLAGRALQWASSDTMLARVSASGLVTGISGGDVTITATAEQQEGTSAVLVVDPTAPRLQSITPFPMVEGASATVTGLNFGASAVDNTVTVDGVAALVTAGSATSVTFTVPPTGCRPYRSAQVRLTAGGKTGVAAHPLRPAAFSQVGVGAQLIVPASSAPCIQLDATSAFESYLVGVQSVSENPASVTAVRISSRIGFAAQGAGAVAPLPAPLAAPRTTPLGPTPEAAVLAAGRRYHLEARQAESALLARAPDFSAAAAGALQSVIPTNATLGQRFTVRVPPHYPGSCTQFTTITAELRRITDRGQWLVDVTNLSTTYSSGELQAITDEIEADVIPTLEPVFGALPDTDGNPRMAFVITSRVNDEGWLSYPSLYDYLPTSSCPASNQGDFLYVATPQASNGLPGSLLVSVMGYSMAHDLTHVIQNRAVIAGGTRAPGWIEEGQAGMGEEMYAHRVTGRQPKQNYGSGVMFSQIGQIQPYAMVGSLAFLFGFQASDQPKVSGAPQLCTWVDPRDGDQSAGPCLAPGPSAGAWAFVRWLTDHYGGDNGGDGVLHQGLIDTPGGGFDRIETLVGVPVETLLARFAAALYSDDRVVPVDRTLDFPSWNLLDFDGAVFPTARLVPRARGFAALTETDSVRAASTLYYSFSASGRSATAIEVTGPTGAPLSPLAQVWVVRLQ